MDGKILARHMWRSGIDEPYRLRDKIPLVQRLREDQNKTVLVQGERVVSGRCVNGVRAR